MPRIRSLHPGIFTDERYMALSFPARELVKGIWCEADDQGVFEWKPLTLKARILPADAVDLVALLDELIAGQFVTRFEIEGRSYGAVRNFRRFQRPKKPNSTYLLPAEFRTYVGLDDDGSEPKEDKSPPVPHQFPTSGENPPQMEDGGWRMEDGKKEKKKRARREKPPDRGTNGEAEPYPWPKVDIEGRSVPAEVPMEWVGETYQSHPLVDGYAASEAFGAYWTEGKGAGTTRTKQGWRQCWRGWIGREKPGRTAEWINRYGYDRHLHGSLVEPAQSGATH